MPLIYNHRNYPTKGFNKIFSHTHKIVLDTRSKHLCIYKTSLGKHYLFIFSVNPVNITLTQFGQQLSADTQNIKDRSKPFKKYLTFFLALLVYLLGFWFFVFLSFPSFLSASHRVHQEILSRSALYSTPATSASLPFLRHTRRTPASWPLHWLIPMPDLSALLASSSLLKCPFLNEANPV